MVSLDSMISISRFDLIFLRSTSMVLTQNFFWNKDEEEGGGGVGVGLCFLIRKLVCFRSWITGCVKKKGSKVEGKRRRSILSFVYCL